jgi:hypothetical protein
MAKPWGESGDDAPEKPREGRQSCLDNRRSSVATKWLSVLSVCRNPTAGAYVPTVVVGMYAPVGAAGVYHATICMPWAFIAALWHVEDPTMGAYIATKGVATYAPPPHFQGSE